MMIKPKPVKAIIEFKTFAYTKIEQSIPLTNNTEEKWDIEVDYKHIDKFGHWFKTP